MADLRYKLEQFSKKAPFFPCVLLGIFLLLGYSSHSFFYCVFASCCLLFCWIYWRYALIGLLIGLCFCFFYQKDEVKRKDVADALVCNVRTEVQAKVVHVLSEKYCILDLGDSFHQARVVWRGKGKIGQLLTGSLLLKSARPLKNPTGFEQGKWFQHIGVHALAVGNLQHSGDAFLHRPLFYLGELREEIKARLALGVSNAEAVKVIHSMFLGERYGSKDFLMLQYRLSGTMHVFAVSGLHVMMIGTFAFYFFRFLGLQEAVVIIFTLVVMFAYAGVTGWGTPAIRAALTASIYLGSRLLQRQPSSFNSLAISALIILFFNVDQLFNVGFQLSFIVLLCILLFYEWWKKKLSFLTFVDPFLPTAFYTFMQEKVLMARVWLRDSLAVNFAAWMGSAPLVFWYFRIVSPIGVLVGVPIVLTLFTVLFLSCVSLILGCFHPVFSIGVNKVNSAIALSSYRLATASAAVPMGHRVYKKADTPRVVVLDVRGGGAVYFNLGGGVLFDGGSKIDSSMLQKVITHHGGRLDSLILSHSDGQHAGGLAAMVKEYAVKQVLLPQKSGRSKAEKKLRELCKKSSIALIPAREGRFYQLEKDAFLEILYDGSLRDGQDSNDCCLVVRLHWQGKRILFMNDAGFYTKQWLLEHVNDLQSEILVLGKNTHEEGVYMDFLRAVNPEAILATSHPFYYGEMRSYQWKKDIEKHAKLYELSETGAVTLQVKDDHWNIETMLQKTTPAQK